MPRRHRTPSHKGNSGLLKNARCVKLAAGVAALTIPTAAGASIVYTPVTQLVDAQHTTVDINFASPTSKEILLEYNPATTTSTANLSMYKDGSNGVVSDVKYVPGTSSSTTAHYAAALTAGEVIDATNTTADIFGSSATLRDANGTGEFTSSAGLRYIGVEFTQTSTGPSYYGWIGFNVTNDSSGATLQGQITGYAYQTDHTGIAAGEIPEPCTLALLALGAAGAVAKRRRAQRSAGGR